MFDFLKQCLWKNFAACIDMLKNAVACWPGNNWNADKKFFYIAYHTTIFLDYYLTIGTENFSPRLPYTLINMDEIPKEAVDDVMPDRFYSKDELLGYIQYCREKCRRLISGLTEENIKQQWIDKSNNFNLDLASSVSLNYTILEILFYNLRHVQHHAPQLNLLLRTIFNTALDYVSEAEDDL